MTDFDDNELMIELKTAHQDLQDVIEEYDSLSKQVQNRMITNLNYHTNKLTYVLKRLKYKLNIK